MLTLSLPASLPNEKDWFYFIFFKKIGRPLGGTWVPSDVVGSACRGAVQMRSVNGPRACSSYHLAGWNTILISFLEMFPNCAYSGLFGRRAKYSFCHLLLHVSWRRKTKTTKKNHYQTKGCYFWNITSSLRTAEECTFSPMTYCWFFTSLISIFRPIS